MAGWLRSESILDENDYDTLTVGASATNEVISKARWPITGNGAERLRLDVYVGFVTDADDSSTIGLQDSSGYNVWNSTKTGDIGTSRTGAAFTAATTDICTDNSHGLVTGDVVTLSNSGGALPAGLSSGRRYWVDRIDDNTFYLHSDPKISPSTRVDITDTGTGTHSYVQPTPITITFNPEVAGDQSYVPLRNLIRAVCTTGAGDSVEIVDVIVLQED